MIATTRGRPAAAVVAGVACVLWLTACGGGPELPALSSQSVGSAGGPLKIALQIEPSVHPIPSAEAYSRVARGANVCWFGPRGRLSATHIFHADAAPAMNGGGVEIVVHERAVDQPKPWGYKAFRVTMAETAGLDGTPSAGGTRITVENIRLPDAEAARMRAETIQWAVGTEGCKEDLAADQALAAIAPPPPPAPAPVEPKAKAKSAKSKTAASAK